MMLETGTRTSLKCISKCPPWISSTATETSQQQGQTEPSVPALSLPMLLGDAFHAVFQALLQLGTAGKHRRTAVTYPGSQTPTGV